MRKVAKTTFDGFTTEEQETFRLTLTDIHNVATMEIATEGPLSADEIVAVIQAESSVSAKPKGKLK